MLHGMVRMRIEGFFDRETLIQHFADSAEIVAKWKAADRPVRVLIDATGLLPHTPDNQTFVAQKFSNIYLTDDKVAIIVASALVKMQMRRTQENDDIIQFFDSDAEALIWFNGG